VGSSTERGGTVERYNRRSRWLHAGVYGTVLVLLGTGWWLLAGREGSPSVLARVTGVADTDLHVAVGWALAAVAAAGLLLGWRAVRTFVVESLRFRRGDEAWLARWPAAAATGRFRHHDGHFDPGQRLANLVMGLLLLVLIGSGVGLVLTTGGSVFVWFSRLHRWSTYLFTPVVLGHIVVAAGVLPGYRGVWRSMHLGGRLRREDALRVWPGWTHRQNDGVTTSPTPGAVHEPRPDRLPRSRRHRRRPHP
jgi:formate dehydrogenase subunit gamma